MVRVPATLTVAMATRENHKAAQLAVTTNVVVFTLRDEKLKLLLVRRRRRKGFHEE